MKEIKTAEEIASSNFKGVALFDSKQDAATAKALVVKSMHEYASQFEPKWIPVSERLPEPYTTVLTLGKEGLQCAERIDEDWTVHFSKVENVKIYNPTHWMPLPQPPTNDIEG